MFSMRRFLTALLALSLLVVSLPVAAQDGPTEITLWRHTPDKEAEIETSEAQIQGFNESQDQWKVVAEEIPQGDYTNAVESAALSGNLPCVLDLDAPTVPNFAWAEHIRPLDEYISDDMLDDVLDTALGKYQGTIYSIGQFDAAIAIWARRSVLEEYDIRIPEGVDDYWTLEEFNEILETLYNAEEFDIAIEMFTTYSGEWWTYGFSPILQSFGGDLIDRDNMVEAEGVLNGEAAVEWGNWWQQLFEKGWSDPQGADDQAFIQGRAALAYIGNWFYPSFKDAWGDDLLILPPVDFGEGPVVGAGSWQWGISTSCENPEGAWAFIEYIMQPEQVAAMADATGLMPSTSSAVEYSEKYGGDTELGIFVDIANEFALIRPPTPAYPVITSAFEDAAREIALGADVQNELDDAVDTIQQDIIDNDGYGFSLEPVQ